MQDQERCANCLSCPEDILMLKCGHDLCLQCASRIFTFQKLSNRLQCLLCKAYTELDETSVLELEKILVESYSHSEQRSETSINDKQHITRITSQFKESNLEQNTAKKFCSEHPEEETSYFCFSCNTNCICPECVIHGNHKNHDVKTTRKAFPVIRENIAEWLTSLNHQNKKIFQNREELQQTRRQLRQENKTLKDEITQNFEKLRVLLEQRLQELLIRCDGVLDSNFRILDQQIGVCESELNEVKTSIEFVEKNLQTREESQLLNFYARNRLKVSEILSKEIYSNNIQFELCFQNFDRGEVFEQLTALEQFVSQIGAEKPDFCTQSQNQSDRAQEVQNQSLSASQVLTECSNNGFNRKKTLYRDSVAQRKSLQQEEPSSISLQQELAAKQKAGKQIQQTILKKGLNCNQENNAPNNIC